MKVKLTDIINAVEITNESSESFLDMKTGEIVWIDDWTMDREEAEEISEKLEEHGFCRLPTEYDIHEYSIMEEFIDTLSGSAYNRLSRAIRGRGAFRRFKDDIIEMDIEQDWYDFLAAAYKRIAIEWCEENDIEYEE